MTYKFTAFTAALTAALSLTACGSDGAATESVPLPTGEATGYHEYDDGTSVYEFRGAPTPLGGVDPSKAKSAGTTTVELSCSGPAEAWTDGDAGATEHIEMSTDSRHPYVFASNDPASGGRYSATIKPENQETACGATVYDGDRVEAAANYVNRGTVVVTLEIPANPNA